MKSGKILSLLALVLVSVLACSVALADYAATPGEPHEKKWESKSEFLRVDYEQSTASEHISKTVSRTYEQCSVCGEIRNEQEAVTATNKGPHAMNGSTCSFCGFTCDHPSSSLREIRGGGTYSYTNNGASGHTIHISAVTYVTECMECGATVSTRTVDAESFDGRHELVYKDGKTSCSLCEYVSTDNCDHADHGMYYEFWEGDATCKPNDSETHITTGSAAAYDRCNKCGARLSDYITPDGQVSVPENHWYDDGSNVCGGCGYVKVSETATPAPTPAPSDDSSDSGSSSSSSGSSSSSSSSNSTATPAPTAAPVESTAPAVVVPPVVSNLFSAIENAQLKNANAVVHVVGTEELFTKDEYTHLTKLAPKEQILVTLASIGLRDVVESAIAALGTPLSTEGSELIEEITTRMTAATPEERAAIEEILSTYFPIEEIEIDGVKVTYFIIELSVEVDGEETIQRFGFRQDEEGNWILDDLTSLTSDGEEIETEEASSSVII